jgi:hypothetical protein
MLADSFKMDARRPLHCLLVITTKQSSLGNMSPIKKVFLASLGT